MAVEMTPKIPIFLLIGYHRLKLTRIDVDDIAVYPDFSVVQGPSCIGPLTVLVLVRNCTSHSVSSTPLAWLCVVCPTRNLRFVNE